MTSMRQRIRGVRLSPLAVAGASIAIACGLASAGFAHGGTGGVPADKQQVIDALSQAAASAPQGPIGEVDTTSKHPANPARGVGLEQVSQSYFPTQEFEVRNQWHGPVGGQFYDVFAGGVPGSDGSVIAGGLRIYALPLDPNDPSSPQLVGEFRTGTPSAVSIADYHGKDLMLQSDDGNAMSFDLNTLRFGP